MHKRIERKCELCGVVYLAPRLNSKFCSQKCVGKSFQKRQKESCEVCGKIFEIASYRMKLSRLFSITCSRKCATFVRRGHYLKPSLRPYESLYRHFLRIADFAERQTDLSFDDFLEFVKIKNCHYCDEEIRWAEFRKKGTLRYNLDRRDNSIGYLKSNLLVCCPRCNLGKGNRYSYEEWVVMIAALKSYKRGIEDGRYSLTS